MTNSPWGLLPVEEPSCDPLVWLEALLRTNSHTAYLQQFGSPLAVADFRSQVPVSRYEDLVPYLTRIQAGEPDVLFTGRPVAYERTGGSSGGSKLIPYSAQGLQDFQTCIVPWLANTVRRHGITGRAYFSISPAARKPEFIGSVPVGLSDAAYLGERAGYVLYQQTAVPFSVSDIQDISVWRAQTREYLRAAHDLELISAWSPTFLLRLLADFPDTRELWPDLKVVSCWTSGPSHRYVKDIRRLFPHAVIEPKGLLSTEAVVTVPDLTGQPALACPGFFEFAQNGQVLLDSELALNAEYEVMVTTASGLYRYMTGDRVRYDGCNSDGRPLLEFIGRDALTSDLVGEKLTEAFVGKCLEMIPGFAMLVPDVTRPGYVLISEHDVGPDILSLLDNHLGINPQYAYARKIGQLAPPRALKCRSPLLIVEKVMRQRGVRLGDVKPTALRSEEFWLGLFEGCRI